MRSELTRDKYSGSAHIRGGLIYIYFLSVLILVWCPWLGLLKPRGLQSHGDHAAIYVSVGFEKLKTQNHTVRFTSGLGDWFNIQHGMLRLWLRQKIRIKHTQKTFFDHNSRCLCVLRVACSYEQSSILQLTPQTVQLRW